MTEATPDKIRRVVVAGGGTAGWIAATTLAKHLSPMIEVVLVESDEIGTVGVGESTIPTVRSFHSFIGVDEDAFVRATNASFKLGIGFEDWDRPGDRYFHSFGSVGRSVFVADFQHFWLEARHRGFGRPYGDYSLELRAAAENRFSADPELGLAYAYHLDATAYARFLRGIA
ncbi:MAG: tryptophan 7-halogenase, partial [Sphingomonadales bacterium]|nr:tryptophan 7-halogenase [Sphingomonadales bacterium]